MSRLLRKDIVLIAKKYFDLDLPCSSDELKKAYKRQAQILHPDKNPGDKDSTTSFRKMRRAFDVITGTKGAVLNDKPHELATVDGVLLSTLGKGSSEGKPCETCQTKGYWQLLGDQFIACKMCRGQGAVVKCPKCKSTGIINAKECPYCEGMGQLGVTLASGENSSFKICIPCMGRGGFKATRVYYKYIKCNDCDGEGYHKPTILKRLLG